MLRLWKSKKKHPSIIRNHSFFEAIDRNRPIEEYEFVSLDTELTGLNHRKDAIVSIGAVRIRELRIEAGDNFFTYVHPQRSMPKVSTLIHRITPEQIEDAPRLVEVLPDLIDYIGPALLVGHFVDLDMSFLNRASKRLLGGALHNPCVDSMRLAQAYEERKKGSYYDKFSIGVGYNLGILTKRYNLPVFAEHDALGDAFQAACLFMFLVRKLQEEGRRTLKDLYVASRAAQGVF
jgi:DNA polymerase-3 subunit epsilon